MNTQQPVTQDILEMNKDFIYDYKFRQKTGGPTMPENGEGIKTQRIEKTAASSNMKSEDLLEQMKQWANVSENSTLGGKFTDKERFGQLKSEQEIPNRQKRGTRSLNDFAGTAASQEDADLSEREDEDIYAHYMEQMRKAKLEDTQAEKTGAQPFSGD